MIMMIVIVAGGGGGGVLMLMIAIVVGGRCYCVASAANANCGSVGEKRLYYE